MPETSQDERRTAAVVADLLFNPKVRPHDLAELLGWSLERTRRAMRRGEFGEPLGAEERDLHVTVAGCASYLAGLPEELPPVALFAQAVSLRQLSTGCWPRDAKRMPLAPLLESLLSH